MNGEHPGKSRLTRSRTFALLGLASVLIATTLILWRPFGSSSPMGTVTPPTPPSERVIHFPEDHFIGRLFIRDWDSTWRWSRWEYIGEASGRVTVPFGKDLRLVFIAQRDQDLSPLAEIGELNLQSLALIGGGKTYGLAKEDWPVTSAVALSIITGDDLRFIGGLRSLRELFIIEANISDVGLAHLSGLASLEKLNISHADIGDTGLEQLGKLASIRELNIRGTNLTGEGMAEIGRLPLLRTLSLSWNHQMNDAGLMYLRSLTQLERFDLYATPITDKGLVYLHSIRSLREMEIGGSQFTTKGVAALKLALPDCLIKDLDSSTPVRPGPTPVPPIRPPVS